MTEEIVDTDMMDAIADEKAILAMNHMEESGYSDEADGAMSLSLRFEVVQRMEDTLASLPDDVMSISWHLDPDGTTRLTGAVRVGDQTYAYPGEAETLDPLPSALDSLKKSFSRMMAEGLPCGDYITVHR